MLRCVQYTVTQRKPQNIHYITYGFLNIIFCVYILKLSVARTIAPNEWMAVNHELEVRVRKKPWFTLTCPEFVKQITHSME